MARLGDVCQKATSNIAQKDLEGHSGVYPIYGASGFISNIDFYQQGNPYIAVVKDGAGIGRIMKLPAKSSIIGTMQYIIPNDNVNIGYLAYAMEHMNLSKYFTGATIPHIYFKDYQAEELPLPPMEEQKKIAAVLDKVSDLIAKRRRQLDKLDLLVKARFVEMFGDPITNNNRLPMISLDKLGAWNSGGTPSRANPKYFSGEIDWYSAGELNSLYLTDSIEKITQEAINNSSAKLFREGSMLVGMYDTAAFKMGILQKASASNQACACIEPNDRVNIVWLYHVLQQMKDYFLQQRRGVRQKNLNLGMIKSFEIPFADKALQNQFADFVEQTEKTKASISHSLETLEMLKKSLMQEYFG